MILLWIVGIVWTLLIGVGVLFLSKSKENIKKADFVVVGVVAVVVGIGYGVGFYVPVNPTTYLFWFFVVFLIITFYSIFLMVSPYKLKKGSWKIVGNVVFAIIMLLFVTTSALIRPTAVSCVVKLKKADEDLFAKIEPKKVRLVPKQTAIMLAEKTLGSESKNGVVLGSQLQIDKAHTTIQKINNSLYWVVPLGYKGIFKQFSFGPIPGFILVDAYDPNKPAIFKDGYHINYSLMAYFGRWAKRKLWLNDITAVLADFSFEVDDNLKPYVVATVLKPAVGFGKFMPIGVKVLDVQSGDIKFYPIGKVPDWIDRVVPEDVIAERLDEKGTWHNGIISALFTGNGTWELTNYNGSHEMFFVEDGAGKTYWVSGVTSTGKDDSIIALVAVDTKTAKAYWIPMRGPTEKAVKDVVESSLGVNKSVWEAKLPILYNIYGKLVWVSVVVDKNRAYPIKYALVDSRNITHYVVKRSFDEALTAFFQNIKVPDLKKEVFIYADTIKRISITNDYLYFWASGYVWQCSIKKHPICAVVTKGDYIYSLGFKKGKIIWVEKIKDNSLTK